VQPGQCAVIGTRYLYNGEQVLCKLKAGEQFSLSFEVGDLHIYSKDLQMANGDQARSE
jgi:hypothetical protein